MPARVTVGVLNDMADLSGPDDAQTHDPTEWLEREVAAVRAVGRLDAEVAFVHAYSLGLPSGTAEAVERAYRQLADAGVGLIVGPAIADNALIATPLAEQLRIPTINFAATGRARSRWMFQHQVGSHEDESLVIARHLSALGCRRIAVVHDDTPVGSRLTKYLDDEARILGLQVVSRQGVSPLADSAADAIGAVLSAEPDAIVHLGFGTAALAVAAALAAARWDGPAMMNGAGKIGHDGDRGRDLERWFYVDSYSDANATLQSIMADSRAPLRQAPAVARGHDLGRLVAEGLARATDLGREGIRAGLEQVRWLHAAQGLEGTLLGFGTWGRAALHGHYLVVRQWLGGESREVTHTMEMAR